MPSVSTTKCPKCRSTLLRRSKWRGSEERMLGGILSPYRCLACNKRFLKPSHRLGSVMSVGVLSLLIFAAIWSVIYVINLDPSEPVARPIGASSSPVAAGTQTTASSAPDIPLARRATAGDVQAQYDLGLQYLSGDRATPKNAAQALQWLEMAAKKGHADARYNLGIMYRAGQGALQNFETAFHWFELAAMQNHVEAQYNVGLMYKTGMSVPVDMVKAYTWVNLAAAQGHIGAIAARDSLLQSMTPQQITEGQRASREWKSAAQADKPPENDKADPAVAKRK